MKEPDVMAKLKWTQKRYAQAFWGQRKLTGFGFKAPSYPVRVKGLKTRANLPELIRDAEPDQSVVQPHAQPPVLILDEQPAKYWGWCKYQYWKHSKANFVEVKARALEVLDTCPTEVIQCFINRSWQFIDSYRKGLTDEAAAWVVRKQKSYRSVSEIAIKPLEAQSKLK